MQSFQSVLEMFHTKDAFFPNFELRAVEETNLLWVENGLRKVGIRVRFLLTLWLQICVFEEIKVNNRICTNKS